MVLTMKTLIFFWFTERSDFKGGVLKNQYVGGDCLKRGGGAWTVCWFKGGLGKKEEDGVFEVGGWYPKAYYVPLHITINLYMFCQVCKEWSSLLNRTVLREMYHQFWFITLPRKGNAVNEIRQVFIEKQNQVTCK